MSIAAQITARIRSVIENPEAVPAAELGGLATRYQDYCAQANARLRQVSELIGKNMVSEALRLAGSEPPLAELCAELNSVGADRWRDLCSRKGWAVAEPLLPAALQLLKAAATSGVALEPLLREYRKAVRAGDTSRVVRLLRQIARLDAKNPAWVEDLRRFEQKRLGEIQTMLQAPAQKNGKALLLPLLVELDEFPADQGEASRLRKVAAACLKEVYVDEAGAEGAKLLCALSAAYAAQNVTQTAELLGQYTALQQQGYFQPTPRLQTQHDEALDWLQHEQKKLERQKAYEDLLATLTLEVEMGFSGKLEERLAQLVRFHQPIPEALEKRARLLIGRHRRAKKRRRQLNLAAAAGLVLVLGAGGTFAVLQYQFGKEVAGAEAELAQLYRVHDRAGFEAYLTALENNRAKVFDAPEVQVWVAKKAELVRLQEQGQATGQKLLARLDAVRQGGYLEDRAMIADLVAQAKTCALRGEDLGRLDLFVSAWATHQRKAQAGKDGDVRALLGQLGEALPGADAFALQNPDELGKKIAEAQDLLTLAGKIQDATPELVQQLNAQKARVGELAKGLAARQELIAAMTTASSLYDYLESMRRYVAAFPGDGLAKNFAHWLEYEAVYKEFSAIITPELSNRVWNATAGELALHDKRLKEKWPEIQGTIASLGDDKELVDLYASSYLAELGVRHQVYFKGRPHEVKTGMVGYGGLAYEPRATDQQAIFKTLNKPRDTFEDALGKLLPHCTWVKALIAEAGRTTSDASDLFLLNKMMELKNNNDIPVLLRLRLISFMMDRLLDLSGAGEGSSWTLLAGKLKEVDQDLSWLCAANPAVRAASQKAAAIMSASFSDSRQLGLYRAEWLLKRVAVDRTVQWVGFAPFKAGAPAVMTAKRGTLELWVIRPGPMPEAFDIRVWEEQRGAERVHYEAALPGEPLFAPIATKSTRALLQEIKATSGIADLNPAAWKNLPWPTNLRD